MDRRSWPWKKKPSDSKNDTTPDLTSRNHDEQVTRGLPQEKRVLDSDLHLQHYEEKNRVLSEKLSLALAEITAKDNLVKQHAKVAEEAVSGWEKAESEAGLLKKQLDATVQQKSSVENRVAHLDGALKECMRELRTAREDHEQKLQETLTRKAKEWDKLRSELEARLAFANDRIIEGEAQKNVLSRSLQERARTISELTEANARVEAEAKVVQVQKEEVEKACSALKYEVQVLSKEVEIRNEEKDYNKKMADAVSKQQLENVKKIAKLEAECQRLRGLVRKKLPGPAAVAQMRLEADAGGREHPRSMRTKSSSIGVDSSLLEEASQNDSREVEAVSERLLAMEEETKMLKEALAKKTHELQAARLMCAKTASKLSLVEEQLERVQGTAESGMSKMRNHNNSHASADSWASALVAQLEQFKKGKEGSYSEKTFESSNFDLMDDFAEMERLATASSESTTASESGAAIHDERVSYEEALFRKERECYEAKEMCEELKKKLASAEEQLKLLESKAAKETNLVTDMDRIFAQARDRWTLRKLQHSDSLESRDRLSSAVSRLMRLVESLAQEIVDEKAGASNLDLDVGIKRLVSAGNGLLQGKGDVLEFIAELSSVLSVLQDLGGSLSLSKSQGGENKSSSSDGDAEANNYALLQEDSAKLKAEKANIEQELQLANERIERLKVQLSESEQLVSTLRVQLASMEESKKLAENELTAMANVKAELESKFRASCVEMGRLQDNISALENELTDQRQRHEEALQTLQMQAPQQSSVSIRSPQPLSEDAARLQEREIVVAAEKLADCQRTIIALGKQLHGLALPAGSSRGSMDFSDASMSPVEHRNHHHQRTEDPFSLKAETVHSESDDESNSALSGLQWQIQRSASDMSRIRTARENIRKQEIYWSSALSPEPAQENGQVERHSNYRKPGQEGEFFASSPVVEERSSATSYSSKNGTSGFSRFFHRRASLH